MKLQVHGREAYCYTGGKAFDAALPCIVFVHGAMNDHGNFTLLARWFAHHGFCVLAPDLPGHMRSAGPALRICPGMSGASTHQPWCANQRASSVKTLWSPKAP